MAIADQERSKETDIQFYKRVAKARDCDVSVGGDGLKKALPQSRIEKATEDMGLMGIKWGFECSPDITIEKIGEAHLISFKGIFFFKRLEERGRIPIETDMPFKMNEDCKKSIYTDAMAKALSKIGYNAELYYSDEAREAGKPNPTQSTGATQQPMAEEVGVNAIQIDIEGSDSYIFGLNNPIPKKVMDSKFFDGMKAVFEIPQTNHTDMMKNLEEEYLVSAERKEELLSCIPVSE